MKRPIGKQLTVAAMLLLSLALLAGCAAPAPQATATPEAQAAATEQPAATQPETATQAAAATKAAATTAEPTRIPVATVAVTAAPTAAVTDTPTPDPSSVVALKTFSPDELAKYNGQNGNPAYIAVEGIVYDVSDIAQWKGGTHFNGYTAGKDLTEEIKKAPHGMSKLASLPIVGLYQP